MDGPDNLARRGQAYSAIQNVPATPSVLTLDMMPRERQLLDYILVLRKHIWLIFAVFLATVTIVTVATFRMQPIYEATARIEIDYEDLSVLPFNGAPGGYADDSYLDHESFIATQTKILASQSLAQQTIKSLKLDLDPRFGGHPRDTSTLEVVPASDVIPPPPPALGVFLGGLTVTRVPNSQLVDVTFATVDPQLAAKIVNAHINNFIDLNFRSHYDSTLQASNWLSGQLDDLKSKVESSEQARIAYERQNQIWTIDSGKDDVTTQKLSDLDRQLTQVQADLINKQAVFDLVQAGNFDAVPAVRGSAVIQDLVKEENELSSQYADALQQYGPKFPKVLRLEEQKKNLDSFMTQEKTLIGNQIEADYRGTRQRELLLQQALDRQKNETAAMANKMVEYNILQRDADANKQMYDGLLQKLKEAGITAGLRSNNIRMIDPAYAPTGPSKPNKTRNISLAIMVGLLGGMGLAVLREYMDNTVKNPDDIEMLGRLPALAVVPAVAGSDAPHRRRLSRLLKPASIDNPQGSVELASHLQPRSHMAESFRALRTSLLLSQADHPPQVILLTSPLPREGKTTAAVNLAVTLAQLGDKTLLIDADLRKPGVSRALNMADGKYVGLSSYLAGVSSLDLVSLPHPEISNLTVIPTGPVPPNPADLLASHRLAEMVTELRKSYKFIVIDSPPIMAATDAVILSVAADGVLMVVRSGQTPKDAFTRTRDLLMSVKCHILGVVLNDVTASASNYYYSYRYYPYAHGSYGDEDRDQKEDKKDKKGLVLNV